MNPVGEAPGFVVPLFANSAPDNKLYVQSIGANDAITDFRPVDIGDFALVHHPVEINRQVGEAALWGFAFGDDRTIVDERFGLHSLLDHGDLPPLLRLQVATLVEAPDLPRYMAQAFASIESLSASSAQLWRDLIILLPRVRRTVRNAHPRPNPKIRAAIDWLNLRTDGRTLHIDAADVLLAASGGVAEFAAALSLLQPIFDAFDITSIDVRTSTVPVVEAPPDLGEQKSTFTVIHCVAGDSSRPVRPLRDVRHFAQKELLGDDGVPRLPAPTRKDIILLVVEDRAENIEGASKIAMAISEMGAPVGALLIPHRSTKAGASEGRRFIARTPRLAELARHSRWIALAGACIDEESGWELPPAPCNPHAERQIDEVGRWTPHAMRACVTAGAAGAEALEILGTGGELGGMSITCATSRGTSAATTAARAALAMSRQSDCPALTAKDIVLVVFHNRNLRAETLDQIEHAARQWNSAARVIVIEEHRADLVKRVRVVAFAQGRRAHVGDQYLPPSRFMPLVRLGWKFSQAYGRADPLLAIGRQLLPLRSEPDLIVTNDNVDDIIRSTPMHDGIIALLVRAIRDRSAIERLISAGICCGIGTDNSSLNRFAGEPGGAVKRAHATLSRAQICERLRHLAGHYALAGLWHLANDRELDGAGIHTLWATGVYQREPVLERFEFLRQAKDSTSFFRGIIRLDPAHDDSVHRLRYSFGFALDAQGFRPTQMKPVPGEFDVRADVRKRFDARHRLAWRSSLARAMRDFADTVAAGRQMEIPSLLVEDGISKNDEEG